jgi:signal transduction histidine kinase
VYSIAQEQCNNIIKYTKAKKVLFRLATLQDIFNMTIRDDGQGAEHDILKNGISLRNIKGRVETFDGNIKIETAPCKGFRLDIMIPVGMS